MRCPRCDAQLAPIMVPPAAESLFTTTTPGGCPVCLTVVDAAVDPAVGPSSVLSFDAPVAHAAMWSVLGDLPQMAVSHERIDTALALAEEAGVDVFLELERLAADPAIDAHFDIDRRRRQLAAFVD
jgi:hypothetical protein